MQKTSVDELIKFALFLCFFVLILLRGLQIDQRIENLEQIQMLQERAKVLERAIGLVDAEIRRLDAEYSSLHPESNQYPSKEHTKESLPVETESAFLKELKQRLAEENMRTSRRFGGRKSGTSQKV